MKLNDLQNMKAATSDLFFLTIPNALKQYTL